MSKIVHFRRINILWGIKLLSVGNGIDHLSILSTGHFNLTPTVRSLKIGFVARGLRTYIIRESEGWRIHKDGKPHYSLI
jgi:hypothetical protein